MWGSIETLGGSEHWLLQEIPSKQCPHPRSKRSQVGQWLQELLVGEKHRPGIHHESGHLCEVDCWLSDQEHRKGMERSWPSNKGVQSLRISFRKWPLGDLNRGSTDWHNREQGCLPAELHLREAGGDPVPQVRLGQLLGKWGWASVLCSYSWND